MKIKRTFKAMAAVFSALCMLPAAYTTVFASEPWQEAYLEKAEEFPSAVFRLCDIDGDEIPEMVVYTGEYSGDCWQLYTYYSGNAQKFFEESIRASMHFYSSETGVFRVYGTTKAGLVSDSSYYMLENGTSSEICLFTHDQAEMADGVNDDYYIDHELVDADTYNEKLAEIESEYSVSGAFEITPDVYTYDEFKQYLAGDGGSESETEAELSTTATEAVIEQTTDTTESAVEETTNTPESDTAQPTTVITSYKKTSSPDTNSSSVIPLIFDAAVFGSLALYTRKRR